MYTALVGKPVWRKRREHAVGRLEQIMHSEGGYAAPKIMPGYAAKSTMSYIEAAGIASAASGGFFASADFAASLSLMASTLRLPFNGGKSNVLLLPELPAAHLPTLLPRYPLSHVNAPTQGCTFQFTSNVAFLLSASKPLGSVI